jgi:broad specificity phosphatase PhoE
MGPTEKLLSSTFDAILTVPLLTQILVIRHAEVHNPDDILYGRLPRFRLNDRGWFQAEVTAKFLAARPLTTVYTSPLLRARQTARVLKHYHPSAQIRTSQDLIEVRTSYQGSPNSILKPGFSFYDPVRDPNDETMEQIFSRVLRFLSMVARRHAGGTVAAVSHADPITVMRVGLEGRALTTKELHQVVYPARSSVTQVTLEPRRPHALSYFNVADVAEVKL